ncbi:MAG TPA: cytochrome c biogenesis protein CcsA [Verrucomicrobiae bacterium]|nr:cytochrome c biogenesis protein CcsA [Verrucomicrobiae bacterium]
MNNRAAFWLVCHPAHGDGSLSRKRRGFAVVRQTARSGLASLGITLLCLLAVGPSAVADDLDFSTLKYLAVQKDGRKKPLDTVAIETVEKLTGKKTFVDPESGRTMEPMDVLLAMWFQSRDWSKTPVILVNYRPLKVKLGLPVDQKYFTYEQLATPQLQALVERVAEKDRRKEDLTHDDREASVVEQRLQTLTDAVGPQSLAVVPHPSNPKGAWVPVTEAAKYYGADKEAELQNIFKALATAYVQRDPGTFASASHDLSQFLRGLAPGTVLVPQERSAYSLLPVPNTPKMIAEPLYPSFSSLRREVHYNSFHAFRKAWMFYLIAFVWLLATWRVRNAAVYWIGVGAFVAGVLVHGYGFYLRIMISGRPPITNMYESVVWVSFGAALFALILELIYRPRYYLVAVAPLSVVMLLLADQFPAVLDPSIGPLVPVLRDNFWLSIHVPTITLGYAAFAVAMAVGHIALGYYVLAPQAQSTIAKVENFVYRAMQIGVLLLAAGTILGGIWAHYAWGRFWGWDPKETWALIALVSYLIPLHGRLAGWMSNFALSVASVVCFMAVLMAWYGVNFVLGKGLHSYGFGVGGIGYVAGFVGIELALVGFAAWRRAQQAAGSSRSEEPQMKLAVK